MKRIFFVLFLSFFTFCSYSQSDVTTFLGIPVDGLKSAMKKKIIDKGFTLNTTTDTEFFEGEFNGTNVNLCIVTNNNKVYRIMLVDTNLIDEASIIIRFNRLVDQFKKNKRYITFDDYTLPDDEDISYEMTVNNKIYEAVFYQLTDNENIDELLQSKSENEILNLLQKRPVWFRISEYYGKYYISMFYDNEYNHSNGEDL